MSSAYRRKVTAPTAVQFAERYRCLQLLEAKGNQIVKYPLATLQTVFLLVTIRCMCGVVKMDGHMRAYNMNCTTGFVVFLAVTFKALGQVYEKSEEILWQQKNLLAGKLFRRFHRSCRPLKIQVAGIYFMDLPMSLTMGSFVMENVANILILKTE